ncbi:RDD family protein [Litorihabitans aurantiacus]|uniref:FHA domain-containing protein n=1 Tax=Litorihabitans aurantiacus TaxID=1930061 RepID=A0AA37XFZ7_9MICO|nr:RDD family protein [Litorihabitans aurantiacus]GMA32361.1 hypothetical protein GCM10025875_23530 [Litorihabitans aurantiacus]
MAVPPRPGTTVSPARPVGPGALTAGPVTTLSAPALSRAGVGPRLAAYGIDLAVVAVLGVAGWLLHGVVLGVVLALEAALVIAVVEARTGLTPGKAATATRATTAGDDHAPGLRREAVRASLFGLAHLGAGLGQIALLAASGRTRAWHDRVAGTDVVTLRPASSRSGRGVSSAPATSPAVPAVPPVPAQPVAAAAPAWPSAAPAARAPWRPPELLDVAVGSDSISMREFRAMRDAAAGRPRPAVPPRPDAAPQPASTAQAPAPAAPAPRPTAPAATPPPTAPAATPRTTAPVVPARPTASTGASTPSAPKPSAPSSAAPSSSASAPISRVPGAAAPVSRVVLTTADGVRHTVAGSAVVGRRPRSEDPAVQIVEIADVARSLSRTHVRVRVADGAAWVEDAGSANGTRLVAPTGAVTPLGQGAPVRLVDGAVLELGQVRLRVSLS